MFDIGDSRGYVAAVGSRREGRRGNDEFSEELNLSIRQIIEKTLSQYRSMIPPIDPEGWRLGCPQQDDDCHDIQRMM